MHFRRLLFLGVPTRKPQTMRATDVSVVLAHGAWADGSSWAKVASPLIAAGHSVTAAPLPLSSFDADVAAVERTLERARGRIVLVAHAYAGAVIAAVRNERVRALVYVTALAPDEGETVADVFYRVAPHPKAPHLAPDAHGFIWMPADGFANAVAHNASPDQLTIMNAVQRPIAVPCIQEKVLAPVWKTNPSWYLLAEDDRMIL